jgi:UDP-N-acetylmuramoyl-L-alanyl-D-glutamate--2,6-diaminopimelate ligase
MPIVKMFEEIKENFEQKFTGIACDSRLVQPGNLFFAITCDQTIEHIRQALANGAQAIVIDQDYLHHLADQSPQTIYIPVASVRAKLGELAAHQYPRQPDINLAVTGTNGKSSVVAFVRQIWEAMSYPAVSLGTLGAEFSATTPFENVSLPKLTTPDALALHRFLHQLKDNDINHFVFEASSHGLDQYRCHQVQLTAAGFTNLTQDHLDYHGSLESYFEAKQRLFSEILPSGKVAVINAHSPYAKSLCYLINSRRQEVITYGVDVEADLSARHIRLHNTHIRFDLEYGGCKWQDICLNMVGAFQIENVLCALGLVMACGEDIEHILPILPRLTSARGRMQLAARLSHGAAIFVDYAHTPDALKRSLQALRHHLPLEGRLHVVFGCGGDRDTGKRQPMGSIAQELADVVYVTDDNPRFEDPAYIRAQILCGCPKAIEIAQREEAIRQAISHLEPQDILLVAGKGHEVGQIIRGEILPFDDLAVVQKYS